MATRSFWKSLLFRFAALVMALSPFVAAEGVCRYFGWGLPAHFDDPFVGFSDINPLFVLNSKTGRYEIPNSRLKFFCEESFAAKNLSGEFRIFVLGGSTVQGRPYQKETSFTSWLELNLRAAEPKRRWEVINCGGISYASYRLVPILEEVLQYQPDLIIVCTGHNEFLEDRTYAHIKNRSAYLSYPHQQIARLRLFNLMRGGYLAVTHKDDQAAVTERSMLGAEVDARLDWKNGLEKYHRDDDWRKTVTEHFAYNLSRMTVVAKKAKAPLIFVAPVTNYDWPPFKSEHRAGITAERLHLFEDLRQRARASAKMTDAIALLRQAAQIDDRYALVHHEIGKRLLLQGSFTDAHLSLEKSLEEDICPLRMLSSMRADMNTIAAESGVPLVDVHELIAQRSDGGVTGARWLVDHVHPTIEGHQLIADELMNELIRQEIVKPVASWRTARTGIFAKHLERLPAGYHSRGLERLKGLRRWASGRVEFEKK